MKLTIKRCVFCKSTAEIIDVSRYGFAQGYTVACSNVECPVYPITKQIPTKVAAILEWNNLQEAAVIPE